MPLSKPIIFETTFARFTGTDVIGEGGAGRIYRAVDDAGKAYAVKLLLGEKATGEKAKRFKNEILFCARNQHPNIIAVIDHGPFIDGTKHSLFYVMPLYLKSLRTLMTRGIPQEKVLAYFAQLLDGVEAAHLQQVIHRDLKPENVLYDEQQDRLLIADFGIAHFEEEALYTSVETQPNARLANFQYAAPEQRTRGKTIDQRADIYALGLLLNELFTGQVPHGTGYKTIESVAPGYAYLDEIVAAMLRQSAAERPASIEVIKNELIGRKQEFITRQRISELKQTVVPVTDLDDQLVSDPPHLTGYHYEKGVLILYFQRPVNEKWRQALLHMGNHTALWNKGPEHFGFSGDQASIPAQENDIQQIIDYF
ncbi:MAG TPA: serine/threonine-protein kinase, partial [Ktedonobacteraceae bacterium]|nr:serine/threonine-protein kinase [Ktedonobacteraceae bacterium]